MAELTEIQRDKLVADLRLVIADAEELLRLSASDLSGGASALRDRVEARIRDARDSLAGLQEAAIEKAKDADDWVHEKPWLAVGAAAGVGLLLGLLIGRR